MLLLILKTAKSTRRSVSLSRFDMAALLTLLVSASLAGLLLWRGDVVGVRIIAVSPADDATQVSSRTQLQITFDREMQVSEADLPLRFNPPISGTFRWEGPTLTFIPEAPLLPDTRYTASLAAGLESQEGRLLLNPYMWEFQTGQPRILYLVPDEQDRDQLAIITPAGGESVVLTQETLGVFDYALAPDGGQIAYSVPKEDGSNDIWSIASDGSNRRQLLSCLNALCSTITWAPDSRRLIYERRTVIPGASPGAPHLWWLDLANGTTFSVFEDSQQTAYGAQFSPDGRWLSYVSATEQGVHVIELEGEQSYFIPGQMGYVPVWSPDGAALVISEFRTQGERLGLHLLRAEFKNDQLINLSGDMQVEDNGVAWSPDGEWIAFGRKSAGVSMGRQIWIMRADGSQATHLTTDPDTAYGPPEWSPDGRYLLFHGFPLKVAGAEPSLWLFDLENNRLQAVTSPGSRAAWLP